MSATGASVVRINVRLEPLNWDRARAAPFGLFVRLDGGTGDINANNPCDDGVTCLWIAVARSVDSTTVSTHGADMVVASRDPYVSPGSGATMNVSRHRTPNHAGVKGQSKVTR